MRNNQAQIEEKKHTADHSKLQQRQRQMLRQLALIQAHGSEDDIRKLDLVLDFFVSIVGAPAAARTALPTFIEDAKSRPFTKAFAELVAHHPSFARDRAALEVIASAVREDCMGGAVLMN